MTGLEALRERILAIDEAMLKLWAERDEAARKIGRLKREKGLPLQNFEAEKAVLDHAASIAGGVGLSVDRTRALVRILIESALGAQERDRVQATGPDGRRAVIVGGAGLMGSWFARFLSEQGYTVSVKDQRESTFPAPREGERFDLVVVATPPSTVSSVLAAASALAKASGLIVDIASVKGDASDTLQGLASAGRKVASLHPMFGPMVDTLMGRNVLVLDCGRADAVAEARGLFAATAAQTRELGLADHDRLMAEVLGLSHATSLVFSEALRSGSFGFRELEAVASTTFRKQADVSREVANENPRLYYEIQTLNRENLGMLRRFEAAATKLRQVVESKDRLGFSDMMHRASAYYQGVPLRSK